MSGVCFSKLGQADFKVFDNLHHQVPRTSKPMFDQNVRWKERKYFMLKACSPCIAKILKVWQSPKHAYICAPLAVHFSSIQSISVHVSFVIIEYNSVHISLAFV